MYKGGQQFFISYNENSRITNNKPKRLNSQEKVDKT